MNNQKIIPCCVIEEEEEEKMNTVTKRTTMKKPELLKACGNMKKEIHRQNNLIEKLKMENDVHKLKIKILEEQIQDEINITNQWRYLYEQLHSSHMVNDRQSKKRRLM